MKMKSSLESIDDRQRVVVKFVEVKNPCVVRRVAIDLQEIRYRLSRGLGHEH